MSIRGCLLPLVMLGQSTAVPHMKNIPQNPKVLKTLNLGFLAISFVLFASLCLFPNSANYSKAPTFP